MLLHFLMATSITTVLAAKPEVVHLDSPTQFCSDPPIDGDGHFSLRSDLFCHQPLLVPKGQIAHISFGNRDKYCDTLTEEEKADAQVSDDISSINFCSSPTRSFSLPTGSHYIAVLPAAFPLQLAVSYHNTNIECDDKVSSIFIDTPLTLTPTARKCIIILPARTVLEIRNVERKESGSTNPRHCVRVRMGKHFKSLNVRWEPVCEVPANDMVEYELGCNAIVMEASSHAIKKVEFIIRRMDDFKAVMAPLMCAHNDEMIKRNPT